MTRGSSDLHGFEMHVLVVEGSVTVKNCTPLHHYLLTSAGVLQAKSPARYALRKKLFRSVLHAIQSP